MYIIRDGPDPRSLILPRIHLQFIIPRIIDQFMKYMLASNVSRLLPDLKATQSSLEFMHGLIEIHHASTIEIQIIVSSCRIRTKRWDMGPREIFRSLWPMGISWRFLWRVSISARKWTKLVSGNKSTRAMRKRNSPSRWSSKYRIFNDLWHFWQKVYKNNTYKWNNRLNITHFRITSDYDRRELSPSIDII